MTSWKKGRVRFFDEKRGTGIIEDNSGQFWDIHYSAIECKKKWKSLKRDTLVKFRPVEDPDFLQVLKCKEVA